MRFVGSEELKCRKYSLALDADIRIDFYKGKKKILILFFLLKQRDIVTYNLTFLVSSV